jgi:hypothetical protein
MRRTCPVQIRLSVFDAGAVWMSVGGSNVGIGMGRHGVGDKKFMFLAEMLPKLRFLWSFHLFVITQPYGGSGVR